jgi:nucleoredoxin
MKLPFSLQAKLGRQFKVSGIPKLVFIDGCSGDLITGDGRASIMEDPEGKAFPWRPEPLEEMLVGPAIKGTSQVELADAIQGKIRAFYFSAHWVSTAGGVQSSFVVCQFLILGCGHLHS